MAGRMEGKTALITGASSGIGAETARLFAAEGARVVLVARGMDKLQGVLEEIAAAGGEAMAAAADVSRREDCERAVEAAVERFGGIDVLVNNAGMADKHRPITRTDDDWWRKVCRVNQDSIFYMTRAALRHMEGRPGSIVNVASIGGVFGSSGVSYSASKSAVLGMTKNIAIQFAGKGIRCNAICPGPTPTPLNTPEMLATFDQEFAEICYAHLDLSLPQATARDQAEAILFFASDASRAVTGQVMIVDNGMTL